MSSKFIYECIHKIMIMSYSYFVIDHRLLTFSELKRPQLLILKIFYFSMSSQDNYDVSVK